LKDIQSHLFYSFHNMVILHKHLILNQQAQLIAHLPSLLVLQQLTIFPTLENRI
jgi:hypothetical protein